MLFFSFIFNTGTGLDYIKFQRKAKSGLVLGIGGSLAFGGIGVWTGNDSFFQEFVSPFLTNIDPELSHKAAVTLAKYHLQRRSLVEDASNLVSCTSSKFNFVFGCICFVFFVFRKPKLVH